MKVTQPEMRQNSLSKEFDVCSSSEGKQGKCLKKQLFDSVPLQGKVSLSKSNCSRSRRRRTIVARLVNSPSEQVAPLGPAAVAGNGSVETGYVTFPLIV